MKDQLAKVIRGERLSEEEASHAMGTIMDGAATPAQIGALLAALAVRGEAEDEVVGFARSMRARAVPVRAREAVDTCGTGGDGAGTFNISTVASLVVAACGVRVAKHGNRSASGACGSADVLEALGVRIDAPVETVQRSLDDVGWAFLFAPAFHASTRSRWRGPRLSRLSATEGSGPSRWRHATRVFRSGISGPSAAGMRPRTPRSSGPCSEGKRDRAGTSCC
jgi:anthranilate phosphoribosyltransferase